MNKTGRKKIALLFLGGSTIDRRGRPGDSVNKPAQVAAWLRQMSEIDIIAETEGIFINAGLDTVGLDEWIKAGQIISQRSDEFYGFVVVHQLATMAAGAVALSLMLPKLGRPVVLCGSPLDDHLKHPASKSPLNLEFGARANFINAAQVAVSDVGEVVLVSGSHIYRGSTVAESAGQTIGQEIGKIDFGIQFFGYQSRRADRRVKLLADFDRRIIVAEYLAGIDLKQMAAAAERAQALLLSMADGSGDLQSIARQLHGVLPRRVIIAVYTTGQLPANNGIMVIPAVSRTAAALKLMWALGQTGDRQKIHRLLKA